MHGVANPPWGDTRGIFAGGTLGYISSRGPPPYTWIPEPNPSGVYPEAYPGGDPPMDIPLETRGDGSEISQNPFRPYGLFLNSAILLLLTFASF